MNLERFIIELDNIVRGGDMKEFNVFVEDEHGEHHDFKFIYDKANKDITISVK